MGKKKKNMSWTESIRLQSLGGLRPPQGTTSARRHKATGGRKSDNQVPSEKKEIRSGRNNTRPWNEEEGDQLRRNAACCFALEGGIISQNSNPWKEKKTV